MENTHNSISDVIIWFSPVAGLLITWFMSRLVSQIETKIDKLEKSVEELSKEIIKIKACLEHIQEGVKIEPREFEKKVVTIFEDNVIKIIKRNMGKSK